MKRTKLCPKCQSKDIYYLPEIADHASNGGAITPMILGLKKNFLWGKTDGSIEAFICSQCGYIEWYLKNPAELETSDFAKKV
jgi:predicted nucleic-acid-binding Zn-ribbon protein